MLFDDQPTRGGAFRSRRSISSTVNQGCIKILIHHFEVENCTDLQSLFISDLCLIVVVEIITLDLSVPFDAFLFLFPHVPASTGLLSFQAMSLVL